MIKKKLILFAYDFPPYDGGIARLCQEIAVGMKAHYEEVLVFSKTKDGINVPYNSEEVKLHQFPSKRGLFEISAIKYFRKIKNKDDYDVLCGQWHPEAILMMISGFKNICLLGHGTEFLSGTSKFRKIFWLNCYCSFILEKMKMIIANSRYTAGLIRNINPLANVKVLPLAVNEKFFTPLLEIEKNTSENLNICTVSRIEKFKGHDFIARVISKLPIDVRKHLKWNIAGKGPDLKYLKELINQLGLTDNVIFSGFVTDQELPNFYSKNDLFILCSRENSATITVEGFGLVFLEAQSCGIPVIGTDSGGISDAVIDGNGGWLIPQDDEKRLSELLLNAYSDRGRLILEGSKGRARVLRDCTWEIYCKNLSQLMNNS